MTDYISAEERIATRTERRRWYSPRRNKVRPWLALAFGLALLLAFW